MAGQGEKMPGDTGQSTTSQHQKRRVKIFDRPLRQAGFPAGMLLVLLLIFVLIILAIYVF
jgi:hypothetical protein